MLSSIYSHSACYGRAPAHDGHDGDGWHVASETLVKGQLWHQVTTWLIRCWQRLQVPGIKSSATKYFAPLSYWTWLSSIFCYFKLVSLCLLRLTCRDVGSDFSLNLVCPIITYCVWTASDYWIKKLVSGLCTSTWFLPLAAVGSPQSFTPCLQSVFLLLSYPSSTTICLKPRM